jgi:hypothetical protein
MAIQGCRQRVATSVLEMIHSPLLRYQSLFNDGRALSFPCDAKGRVAMDVLSERALANFLYARTVVGRDFSVPRVIPAPAH